MCDEKKENDNSAIESSNYKVKKKTSYRAKKQYPWGPFMTHPIITPAKREKKTLEDKKQKKNEKEKRPIDEKAKWGPETNKKNHFERKNENTSQARGGYNGTWR